MTALAALWLPILVSAVFVFIASSVIHMGPFWHRTDYPRLPDENSVASALRPLAIPPGEYMMPRAGSMKEFKTPEFAEKISKGPVVIMTVLPNRAMSMGRNMALWFVYCLVVSFFSSYIAARALPPGAQYLQVFRFIGATAFIGYALALWQMPIWYWRSWSLTLKETLDGMIYALLTAGTFGWLWPRV